jgi:hypothetical protein
VNVSNVASSRRAWARGLAAQFMTDTAAILRRTSAPNLEGGQTETEATVATVICRLQAQSATSTIGQERPEGGRVVAVTLWRALLPAGTDVRPADVLLINGTRYEVTDSNAVSTDNTVVVVTLRRVG